MARVLLIDDDETQLDIRRLIVERVGHAVAVAADIASARRQFQQFQPDLVVMDVRIPGVDDGLALIRELSASERRPRMLVLCGWPADLEGRPEADSVDQVFTKPVRTQRVLDWMARFAVLLIALGVSLHAATFRVLHRAEMIANLEIASPGSDWSRPGCEAALADVRIDGTVSQQVMLYAGAEPHEYPVFLGEQAPGEHTISIERNNQFSAPGSQVRLRSIGVRPAPQTEEDIVANAPVLFARRNTVGKFTDVPMIVYAERLSDSGKPILQYTVIFSNEDGGTSTRALMARWGRTTDVEYVYRAWLNPSGQVERASIQADGHKEVEFKGRRDGSHPLLIPITDNNMISDGEPSAIRYQIAPVLADLTGHSREEVIDDHPFAYRVMSEELLREDKLRPFGTVDGQKISDPRNYIYLEAKVENRGSGFVALARLKNENRWRESNLGREDYAIERSGSVRTTIELPPGTKESDVAELGFGCVVVRPNLSGSCRVDAVSKVFFLSRSYVPNPSFWRESQSVEVPAGQIVSFPMP